MKYPLNKNFVEASIFHKLIGKFIKPEKPYTTSLLTLGLHEATATKLITAAHSKACSQDTSNNSFEKKLMPEQRKLCT